MKNTPLIPHKLDTKYHGLLDCDVAAMNEKLSHRFIAMSKLPEDSKLIISSYRDLQKESFPFAVMLKRIEVYKTDNYELQNVLDKSMLVFIGLLFKTPGDAVMWAYTLNYIYLLNVKYNKSFSGKVTMQTIAETFPMGLPTEKSLQECWDKQKGKNMGEDCDNWIDNFDNWPKR